ncbi:MAG: hypothetical protein GPJ54_14740 [Candidatus Heimdallarchaeota archaeon]|nr:hypothetical protein [Candidatus Heimdallarchaeota archaeon]
MSLLLIVVINILQNGKIIKVDAKLPLITDITGKDAEKLVLKDLYNLSKSQLMKIFMASPAPQIDDLEGEYQAGNFNAGVLAAFVNFFTNHFFGKGKWVGKGFQVSGEVGEGYNVFDHIEGSNRHRRFKTHVGMSNIDGRQSFHLVYREFNKGIRVSSMHDEVRKVNDKLYIGMGSTAWGLGFRNPSPFYIVGPSTPLEADANSMYN